ncbi:MAG: LysR family transcriptional regulator [Anaerolineae bacterium]|nr:LysR family transcriptional regulator [Anaerolineae bacterium]
MLSLYKLEIFGTVVQVGSFSGAAQRLYMTQPAVSQHIQDLEARLGTPLFLRGRRGVTLTPAGKTLYEYTQRILQLVAEAESAVTNVQHLDSGQVTIGATPGVSVYLLPEWIGSFRTLYPQLNVSIQTATTTEIADAVLEHQLDVGFVEGELDTIASKRLGSAILRPVDLFVVVSGSHPWHERERVSVADLDEQPFITRQPGSRTRAWIDDLFSQKGVRPRIVGEFDNQEAIKRAVISNIGVSILPDYAIARETSAGVLYCLPIEDVTLERQMKLIWDTKSPFTAVARAFLSHLVMHFPGIEKVLST